VQEFDDLRRQQTEREREQAKRDWDGHLRRDLLQRDKDRKAASVVPALYTGRVLTVEVRIYRFEAAFRGGDHARNRLAFAGPEDRLDRDGRGLAHDPVLAQPPGQQQGPRQAQHEHRVSALPKRDCARLGRRILRIAL
jgi:hypothetical protein